MFNMAFEQWHLLQLLLMTKVYCNRLKSKSECNRNNMKSDKKIQERQNFGSRNVAFAFDSIQNSFVSDIWIWSGGACMCPLLTDARNKNKVIPMRKGNWIRDTKIGNPKYDFNQVDGNKFTITSIGVKVVRNFVLIHSSKAGSLE
jgi:mannose-6-phosphate isomerase-like protein (cupin superfamily)